MADSKKPEKAKTDIIGQVVERIETSDNVLVALSKNPSVDELSAALGLTFILDKLGKRATAIFSGAVPNAIEFLEPEKTFESNTNSLQDFIIALDKEKADHLRYKIDGDYVKVYITPYRTTIDESDMEFSHGDYNVDLVIALNVENVSDLDAALSEYGRIMHDASSINLHAGEPGRFGDLEWGNPKASSVSEMICQLGEMLKPNGKEIFDKSVSTALLAGIVAATNRFSNEHTTANTMTYAGKLMAAGADQQLISSSIPVDILTTDVVDATPEAKAEEPAVDFDVNQAEPRPAEPQPAENQPAEMPPAEPPAAPAPAPEPAPAPAEPQQDYSAVVAAATAAANEAAANPTEFEISHDEPAVEEAPANQDNVIPDGELSAALAAASANNPALAESAPAAPATPIVGETVDDVINSITNTEEPQNASVESVVDSIANEHENLVSSLEASAAAENGVPLPAPTGGEITLNPALAEAVKEGAVVESKKVIQPLSEQGIAPVEQPDYGAMIDAELGPEGMIDPMAMPPITQPSPIEAAPMAAPMPQPVAQPMPQPVVQPQPTPQPMPQPAAPVAAMPIEAPAMPQAPAMPAPSDNIMAGAELVENPLPMPDANTVLPPPPAPFLPDATMPPAAPAAPMQGAVDMSTIMPAAPAAEPVAQPMPQPAAPAPQQSAQQFVQEVQNSAPAAPQPANATLPNVIQPAGEVSLKAQEANSAYLGSNPAMQDQLYPDPSAFQIPGM